MPLLSPPADACPAPLTLELSVQELLVPNEELIVSLAVCCLDPLISCSAGAFALTQLCLWRLFIVLFRFPALHVSVRFMQHCLCLIQHFSIANVLFLRPPRSHPWSLKG